MSGRVLRPVVVQWRRPRVWRGTDPRPRPLEGGNRFSRRRRLRDFLPTDNALLGFLFVVGGAFVGWAGAFVGALVAGADVLSSLAGMAVGGILGGLLWRWGES